MASYPPISLNSLEERAANLGAELLLAERARAGETLALVRKFSQWAGQAGAIPKIKDLRVQADKLASSLEAMAASPRARGQLMDLLAQALQILEMTDLAPAGSDAVDAALNGRPGSIFSQGLQAEAPELLGCIESELASLAEGNLWDWNPWLALNKLNSLKEFASFCGDQTLTAELGAFQNLFGAWSPPPPPDPETTVQMLGICRRIKQRIEGFTPIKARNQSAVKMGGRP